MPSFKEMILLAKSRKEEAAQRAQLQHQYEADALDRTRHALATAITQALNDLRTIPGVRVDGSSVHLDGLCLTVSLDFESGTTRDSDESPEVSYQTFVIRWRDQHGYCYGGHCSAEEFKKSFAEFIGKHL